MNIDTIIEATSPLLNQDIGVSVIIPLYNGIEFLDQAVLSVVNQTHTCWELTIGVNGYPPDSDIEKEARKITNKLYLS